MCTILVQAKLGTSQLYTDDEDAHIGMLNHHKVQYFIVNPILPYFFVWCNKKNSDIGLFPKNNTAKGCFTCENHQIMAT